MTAASSRRPVVDARRIARLRSRLADWYRRERRDLPWRATRDPYAIWVSEVMLQQTTVAAVVPYWSRFLERFPTIATLAAAPRDDVLAAWSGLGYYRRARHLHEAARVLARAHGGRLPGSARDLRRLPGVGEYTAAAVASIAFGVPLPVVDGNVARCLARVERIDGDPRRQPARGVVRDLAERLLDVDRPGDHNQALMELGATVCMPRAPKCGRCPWTRACRARAAGVEERYPTPAPRPRPTAVVAGHVIVTDARGRILLRRVPDGLVNAGMLDLPAALLHHGDRDAGPAPRVFGRRLARELERRLKEEAGLFVRVGKPIGRASHSITRHRIVAFLADARLDRPAPSGRSWCWEAPARARRRALTALSRKLLRGVAQPSRDRRGAGRSKKAGLPLRRSAGATSARSRPTS